MRESTIDRSCGPSGCEVSWLSSQRLEVDDDPAAFAKLATDAGWGDGLPLIPPTEERVRAYLVARDLVSQSSAAAACICLCVCAEKRTSSCYP